MTHQIVNITDADMAESMRLADLSASGALSHTHLVDSMRSKSAKRGHITPGERYARYADAVKEVLSSDRPEVKREVEAMQRALVGLRTKDVGVSTVHSNTTLSNLSVQYGNDEYVGLSVMPLLTVAKETDSILNYSKRDRLAAPDDAMGSRGQANEINETRSNDSYTCLSYGLSNFVSARTLANQDAPFDEMMDLVEALNEILALREEMRIAAIVTATGSYASTNYTSLSGASRWDTAGGGNPIKDLQTGIAAMWSGRGPSKKVGVCSLNVYQVLSRHPAILDLFKYNGSSPGLATPDMMAKFFGLESLYVGAARKDTANESATASYSRIWSDSFAILRVADRASIRNASFGYTMRHGPKITQVVYEPMNGHGGGYKAQVSLSETHKVIANDAGYLIATPVG